MAVYTKFDKENIDTPYPILVGYMGYPMIKYMEKIKLENPDNINIPDSVLIRPKIVAVFDNIKDLITIMTVVYPNNQNNLEEVFEKTEQELESKINLLKKSLIQQSKTTIKSKLNFKSNYSKFNFASLPFFNGLKPLLGSLL